MEEWATREAVPWLKADSADAAEHAMKWLERGEKAGHADPDTPEKWIARVLRMKPVDQSG